MRRVQVVRRAARRPLTDDQSADNLATAESALRGRRAARDAEIADTLARIDDVTAA